MNKDICYTTSTIEIPQGYMKVLMNLNYHQPPYPKGIIILMDAYIDKQYRENGIFSKLLNDFLSPLDEGITIQVAVENQNLTSLFERIGFEEVKEIEYWGSPENCKCYQLVTSNMNKEIKFNG